MTPRGRLTGLRVNGLAQALTKIGGVSISFDVFIQFPSEKSHLTGQCLFHTLK